MAAVVSVNNVSVVVQTCPERSEAVKATLASLAASDVASRVTVMEHPVGMERCRFYRTVLERMASADTPYVIRCEDDILVNAHLGHNFLSWPALKHPLFGCGWLYVSEMAYVHETAERIDGHLTRKTPIMYGALCVGMPVGHARWCIGLLDAWIEKYGCPLSGCARGRRCSHATRRKENKHAHGQDTLISQAVWRNKRRVFYHKPALAENRLIPTIRGTGFPATTDRRHLQAGPRFSATWKRPG